MMTKPEKKKDRAAEWHFDMPAGVVTHLATGIVFRMLADTHPQIDRQDPPCPLWSVVDVDGAEWIYLGDAQLRPGTIDRRPAAAVAPGDANDPRRGNWPVVAAAERLQAVFDDLARSHGPTQAKGMLERIAREAGERWIFRARHGAQLDHRASSAPADRTCQEGSVFSFAAHAVGEIGRVIRPGTGANTCTATTRPSAHATRNGTSKDCGSSSCATATDASSDAAIMMARLRFMASPRGRRSRART
jgi:hypothetical protein